MGDTEAITKFLEDDENSMISPAVNDTITRKKIKKQKRYLCDSLEKLHQKYNAQSPQRLRISYASFCRVRPFWPKGQANRPRYMYVCHTGKF